MNAFGVVGHTTVSKALFGNKGLKLVARQAKVAHNSMVDKPGRTIASLRQDVASGAPKRMGSEVNRRLANPVGRGFKPKNDGVNVAGLRRNATGQ